MDPNDLLKPSPPDLRTISTSDISDMLERLYGAIETVDANNRRGLLNGVIAALREVLAGT